ncbi:GTPase, partial [Methylobacterium sp. WL116]
ERVREGFWVVLAGPPNAGKSTLLNALSRRDAAIVSPVPGTTRDAIEVRLDLGGLPVMLVDTAGLRETHDPVEAEGIRRTRRRMAEADLVLMLVPPVPKATEPAATGRVLRVRTKADLADGSGGGLAVSALTGQGMPALL